MFDCVLLVPTPKDPNGTIIGGPPNATVNLPWLPPIISNPTLWLASGYRSGPKGGHVFHDPFRVPLPLPQTFSSLGMKTYWSHCPKQTKLLMKPKRRIINRKRAPLSQSCTATMQHDATVKSEGSGEAG